ncbi:BnaC04g47460D [Brassica napus]|uniref:RRM domain-containing protein n=2 Tax=Brassica TaxID=3705 RepID=A0A3P6CZM3_BRAOL|nr:unnamed protein product [Brassica napus]CDY14749.1 BnaC04g47460D [Brassica napus]VDD15851.1 unnamed protein product [Brassica oleracea]
MDVYTILKSATGGFESEAAEKDFVDKCRGKPSYNFCGDDTCLPEDDIKKELINHFNSCGEVLSVIVPKDPESPNLNRRAVVILLGHGAEEKALQLNGTDIGGWNALVKVEPEQEDEESSRYRSSLIDELMNDPKFWYGVSVRGYDTSLPTNIYFSRQEEEARALDLHGTKVGGFKLDISRVPSVLSNRPLGNGQIRLGYTVPAHMIEFAGKTDDEIEDKVIAFKKQRRFI